MNILCTAALEHKSITWAIILVILVGGSFSFDRLSRLEDPALVLPIAKIVTEYPGASPLEVEEEVTLPLEQVVLQLPYVDFIESTSSQGISQIKLILKSATEGDQVPQIWDEMRRKIRSAESHLPWGALPPQIMDDAADLNAVQGKSAGWENRLAP